MDRAALARMGQSMFRRGPDGGAEWYSPDGRVGLAHRRLSIIDLSENGAQPMENQEGSLVVTFNGEIYNFQEIKKRLEAKGYRFKSQSDTEALLHLYAEKGREMVHDLRGMYAFAIWDKRKRELFLARDPFGIKPLYYAADGSTFKAASQVKALLAGGGIDTSPEPAGHVGFFLWGHMPDPYTLYKGIRSLPAGHSLTVNANGELKMEEFCSIPRLFAEAEERGKTASGLDKKAELRRAFVDTVQHHLIADVPVGVFLSAGLDSTTLAALASEQGGELKTVTLGFEEFRGTENDETELAEMVAKRYGAKHQTIWVTRQEFQSHFDELMGAMDQPTTDGVNTFFVSLAAVRASLKVALSGVGGDELFAGYASFQEIPRIVGKLGLFANAPALGRGFRFVSAPLVKRLTSPKYASLLEYGPTHAGAYLLRRGMFMPWELPEVLDGDMVRAGMETLQPVMRLAEAATQVRSPRLKVSVFESCWYMRHQLLRDTDWASMAHSLEIRTPMVDIDFLRQIGPLLGSGSPPVKRDLAQVPLNPLPPEIADRKKTGFYIPVREWLMKLDKPPAQDRGLRGWAKHVYSGFVRP